MRVLLASLCVLVFVQSRANAEMTVKEYQKEVHSSIRDRADAVKLYVIGVGHGISWANTDAAQKGVPLYCQPPKFGLNGDNYIDILEKTIKVFEAKATAKELNEFPVAMVLLTGLEQTFPCQAAK